MKAFKLLPLVAALAACNHPIDIKGQGDVLSATGDRDCYAETAPCENVVKGDYHETYYPVARDGWEFSHWENYCADSAQCAFNIPADTVAQFAGQTVPPLVAVFEPVEPAAEPELITIQAQDYAGAIVEYPGITFTSYSPGNVGPVYGGEDFDAPTFLEVGPTDYLPTMIEHCVNGYEPGASSSCRYGGFIVVEFDQATDYVNTLGYPGPDAMSIIVFDADGNNLDEIWSPLTYTDVSLELERDQADIKYLMMFIAGAGSFNTVNYRSN